MKFSVLITILSIIFILTPNALANTANIKNDVSIKSNGESSNVDVDINNNVNTTNSTKTSQSSKTNVEIDQTGEGTSKVKINDKEWSLSGPGNISVSEGTSSSENPSTISASENQQETKNAIQKLIAQLESLIEKLKSLFKL